MYECHVIFQVFSFGGVAVTFLLCYVYILAAVAQGTQVFGKAGMQIGDEICNRCAGRAPLPDFSSLCMERWGDSAHAFPETCPCLAALLQSCTLGRRPF